MEPLDRYLKTVKQYLPKGQQDDIIQELAENLRSQMEDQEAELGRPLSEEEQQAILERHGHPMAVAGRYRVDRRSFTFGRQLIGPVLFPLYLRILALNVGITLVVCIVAAIVLTSPQSILQTTSTILSHLLLQFAIVTGIFILAESSSARFPDLWRPWSPFSLAPAVRDEGRIPRSQSIAEMIVLTVFILWWPGAPYYPGMLFGSAAPILHFGPGVRILYLAILPLLLVGWVRACIVAIRPRWVRFYWTARVLATSVSLVVVGFSLTTGPWIVAGDRSPSAYQRLIENLNHGFGVGLILLGIAIAVQLAFEIRRLLRRQREPSLAAAL
ncbi:MAG TPA: hypothetical protein VIA62_06105 [Thermoanaerobaculia bacterium]|jgi:hypothetical protein|nr:hypothetical protein [Thermoanaerobaculia bacterium]